jgi:hypothetical protein
MKRLSGALLLVFAIAIAAVWFSFPTGVSIAQNTSDQRISDLETRVARLEDTVYGSATPLASPATSGAAKTTTIEGSGTNVSKSFDLPAGVYRVELIYTIAASSDYVGVTIVASDGSTKLMFNAADKPGQHNASTVLNAGEDTFVLQVQAASDTTWKVTFSPL